MKGNGRRVYIIALQKNACCTSVFAGDEISFFQGSHGTKGDIFEIAYGRGYQREHRLESELIPDNVHFIVELLVFFQNTF